LSCGPSAISPEGGGRTGAGGRGWGLPSAGATQSDSAVSAASAVKCRVMEPRPSPPRKAWGPPGSAPASGTRRPDGPSAISLEFRSSPLGSHPAGRKTRSQRPGGSPACLSADRSPGGLPGRASAHRAPPEKRQLCPAHATGPLILSHAAGPPGNSGARRKEIPVIGNGSPYTPAHQVTAGVGAGSRPRRPRFVSQPGAAVAHGREVPQSHKSRNIVSSPQMTWLRDWYANLLVMHPSDLDPSGDRIVRRRHHAGHLVEGACGACERVGNASRWIPTHRSARHPGLACLTLHRPANSLKASVTRPIRSASLRP